MPQREFDVSAVDELGRRDLQEVVVDGEKVLLAWDGEEIRAVAATCPHAGAPLAQGVRHGTRLICPWHKATFCLRTGAVLEPPALDALASYDAKVRAGRILLSRREAAPSPPNQPDTRCFAIIGAGAAGAVAAQTLREAGFNGRVLLLDEQNRVPYDRTVLSKYALSGEQGAEKSPLQSQAFYREHRIERRTAKVVRLDASMRRITCSDGATFQYDAALVATGGVPRRVAIPGGSLAGVFLLRSCADADAILAQAERSERAVILGASFIGMEVAASLRERGLDVTVTGRDAVPFEKQLGARVGGAIQALHERKGVQFKLGRGATALGGDRTVSGVLLDDGEEIPADLVVAGFGVDPATSFVTDVALNDDGSMSVDAYLRAAEGLYAAGDIARFPDRGDGPPIRVEHWRVAEQQGRVAALNMLGRKTRYSATPVFWTIHYLKRLDYIGHASDWDDVVIHGDLGRPEFLAYYVKEGVVVAAAGMDRDRETAALIELFDLRRTWQPDELGERPAEVLASTGQDGRPPAARE